MRYTLGVVFLATVGVEYPGNKVDRHEKLLTIFSAAFARSAYSESYFLQIKSRPSSLFRFLLSSEVNFSSIKC